VFYLYFSFACSKRKVPKEKDSLGFSATHYWFNYICPQAGRPRHRNAAASEQISLRSINPAKAAYLPAGGQVRRLVYFFLLFRLMKIALRKSRNER
jgi:hypothetical protein